MQETLTARPCGLRMNLRREPWGMPADPAAWRFSWCPPEGQSACRLTIFRGVPDEDPVPLYDTGWMSCTRSTGVSLPADARGRTVRLAGADTRPERKRVPIRSAAFFGV